MSSESEFRGRLVATAAVTSLVSTRIYNMHLPQRPTLPAITYQKISGPREHAMGGDPGLASPRYQVTCWHTSSTGAWALRDAVHGSLSRWQDSGSVQDTFLENELHLYEDENQRHRVILDFILWHTE